MIDIHSHILPGVDDGAINLDMTLEMLNRAEKDGTTKIVATPHFCRGYGEMYYDDIKKMCEKLNKLLIKQNMNIKVYFGQEVYYTETMVSDYIKGIIGTINGTRYMLFELPLNGEVDSKLFDDLYELRVKNVIPILAHPERYKSFINDNSEINKFIDEGVLFQLNSGSLKGVFGSKVKKTAEVFLENSIYSFIGSDAHNDKSRSTEMANEVQCAINKNNIYKKLFHDNGIKLLNDEDIEFVGQKIKRRKSLFGFLGR